MLLPELAPLGLGSLEGGRVLSPTLRVIAGALRSRPSEDQQGGQPEWKGGGRWVVCHREQHHAEANLKPSIRSPRPSGASSGSERLAHAGDDESPEEKAADQAAVAPDTQVFVMWLREVVRHPGRLCVGRARTVSDKRETTAASD